MGWTLAAATGVTAYVQLLQAKPGWPDLSRREHAQRAAWQDLGLNALPACAGTGGESKAGEQPLPMRQAVCPRKRHPAMMQAPPS